VRFSLLLATGLFLALTDLQTLKCPGSAAGKGQLTSLAALQGLKLRTLHCHNTQIADLSAPEEMPPKEIRCDFQAERDADRLRAIETLETINGKPARDFWKEVDARVPDRKP
jgi:hypothetical protein